MTSKLVARRDAVRMIQKVWRRYRIFKMLPKALKFRKDRAASHIQKYVKGYLTHTKLQSVINQRKMKSNFEYFEMMRLRLLSDIQKKLAYRWRVKVQMRKVQQENERRKRELRELKAKKKKESKKRGKKPQNNGDNSTRLRLNGNNSIKRGVSDRKSSRGKDGNSPQTATPTQPISQFGEMAKKVIRTDVNHLGLECISDSEVDEVRDSLPSGMTAEDQVTAIFQAATSPSKIGKMMGNTSAQGYMRLVHEGKIDEPLPRASKTDVCAVKFDRNFNIESVDLEQEKINQKSRDSAGHEIVFSSQEKDTAQVVVGSVFNNT